MALTDNELSEILEQIKQAGKGVEELASVTDPAAMTVILGDGDALKQITMTRLLSFLEQELDIQASGSGATYEYITEEDQAVYIGTKLYIEGELANTGPKLYLGTYVTRYWESGATTGTVAYSDLFPAPTGTVLCEGDGVYDVATKLAYTVTDPEADGWAMLKYATSLG